MESKRLIILNAPVLTSYGVFRFAKLSLDDARRLVREFANDSNKRIESAIGHAATTEMLSELLSFRLETNRRVIVQEPNDLALVFRLNRRLAEGAVLDRAQIEKVGYEFGTLVRFDSL